MKADRKAYQDQKQVQKLGNQRGDGSTGNAHSGGTQLSEDEQIVQPGVRRYRAKTCPKGDSGVFLATQPCGQDGADRHGQIRERHDAEVPRPHTEDGVICRIKSQDLRREAPCRQQKQCCQHTPADKAYIQTAPRLGVLLRTQKLCDQNAGIAGGAVPQGFKAADGSPCPERRILMNGGQSGNAFPACQCIIKANDLHILRDADALSLQKSHKFQRIVVGHRKGAAETVYPLLVHYTVFISTFYHFMRSHGWHSLSPN